LPQHTGAYFRTVISAQAGVVIGWYKFSAAYMAKVNEVDGPMPKLKSWSDIAFLSWLAVGGQQTLRYIVSANVQNDVTNAIIDKLLEKNNIKLDPDWDSFDPFFHCHQFTWDKRRRFDMTTEEGKVLLASPNGLGAAYLLIQHKSTFGAQTTIAGVTMWCETKEETPGPGDDGYDDLNLMFHVRPQLN
jgi:hypothetical protein